MKNKRFGFLTTSGTIAAVLTLIAVAGFGIVTGGRLFNPGALNAKSGAMLGGVSSHAELLNRCSSCHAPFWGQASMADRCESCHTDIRAQWSDATTLHGNLHLNGPALTCRSCHPEHRGAEAALTDMSKVQISHEVFGYSLKAHQLTAEGNPFSCTDCHTSGYKQFSQAVCATCHEKLKPDFMQAHLQAYGNTCLGCHDGVDSYGKTFNHSLAAFKLTGKHTSVACAQCHSGARTIADMKATPADCGSCHAKNDPHQGLLGPDCGSCHTTEAWSPSTFNHDQAVFKLIGKHIGLPCTSCHTDKLFKNTPVDCFSCHQKDDIHQGDLGTDCGSCHTPNDWSEATFDHNLAAFKLTGKHVGVACTSCHVNKVFKGTPMDCFSCHAKDDAHKGQYGTDCSACHSTDGWLPATFDHAKFFPLTGAHAALACTTCHTSGKFAGLSTACAGCHADPAFHLGLFAGTSCSACHSTSAWIPASYNGSHPGGCDGNCISHENATCRDCHTVNLMTATCTKCHDSNNPSGGGGD